MTDWLLLSYSIPSRPSANRVYIWRKLKRLGALLIDESVWALPANARTAEQFQWLAAEIHEKDGQAHLWRAAALLPEQGQRLKTHFIAHIEEGYQAILDALEDEHVDLAEQSRRYQQLAHNDYFHAPLGAALRDRLIALRERDAS
jgi:hypothetical protein